MKKNVWKRCRCYFGVVCIIFITFFAFHQIEVDVTESVKNIELKNLSEDTGIFSKNLEGVLAGYIKQMNIVTEHIQLEDLQDTERLSRLLAIYGKIFDSFSIYNNDGELLSGDQLSINIKGGDELFGHFVSAEEGGYIYDSIVKNKQGVDCIAFCMPYEKNNSKIGQIVVLVKVSELANIISQWNYAEAGTVFVTSQNGDYIVQSRNFNTIIPPNYDNYFEMLDYCSLDDVKADDVVKQIKKGITQKFSYSYSGNEFLTSVYSVNSANWSIACTIPTKAFLTYRVPFRKQTIMCSVLSILGWCALIVSFVRKCKKNKEYQEELERYALIYQEEKSILFEYQFSPKKIRFFEGNTYFLGKKMEDLSGESVFDVYHYVHKDDASIRGRFHEFFDSGKSKFTSEIRLMDSNGAFGWYRITGVLVKNNETGANIKFVGKIEDANQQIAEEKNLVQRAENDLLTGVLNKKTMEEKVTESLKKMKANDHYIFFMIDLDNFKNVNDKLGHIMGDKAITDTAECLRGIFTSKAYIGRLGGDEFAVCAYYDAFDDESLSAYIIKKAEKICEVNRRSYQNTEKKVDITSSVGIAVAPDLAKDFETLYKMADSALYDSKNGGKNCYHIYGKKK